ncbi:MAG TPA: hypothetical protein VIQ24_17860 [Pyrinomonadaceae bacterium]
MLPSTNRLTQYRWKPLLTAAVICFGTSALVAGAEVVFNRNFGASDILPFLIWTLPFAGVIALTKGKLADASRRLPILLRYAVAVAVGIAAGVLWTYIVAFFLGAWFGAFSFLVLPCWIAGGASGMILGIGGYKSMKQSMLVELVFITAICLSAVIAPKYLFDFLTENQRLEVVSISWQPDPEPLNVREGSERGLPDNFKLADEDLSKLKSLGLTGQVAFDGSSGFIGQGKHARTLIVMQRQLKGTVELPQPDGVEVIYIQGEDGWKMYPSDAPTLQRTIRLWADERDPARATLYSIERADGSRQVGTLFTW